MQQRPAGPVLSNPRSDRIRAIRALAGRSVRYRKARFLIEGPQATREAVRARAADELIMTAGAAHRYPEILDLAAGAGISAQLATDEVVAAISDAAQGVIATAPLCEPNLGQVLESDPALIAILHENQDPGNAGTIIRTADAAGAQAVIMTRGSVDIFNPKVVRSSAGSLFHIPVITGLELSDVLSQVAAAGLQILAADARAPYDLDELQDKPAATAGAPQLRLPTAWVFGNEARGLAGVELADGTARVSVPIHGAAESLNLATATALCLYASARVQRAQSR